MNKYYYPYTLITPNCPDGITFSSLDSLARFLADNCLDIKIKVFIDSPI